MDLGSTMLLLSQPRFTSVKEPTQSQLSRLNAMKILKCLQEGDTSLAEANLDLLTTVIKPLFSNSSQHHALTSTGRKKLVSDTPTISNSFSLAEEEKKLWKNGWTVSLLSWILKSYSTIEDGPERKKKFESQFFLLVPPILNILDDTANTSKASGYNLLGLLCQQTLACESEILTRTGLSDVFRDALKVNFMLLPTLTPEDESLAVLGALYPSFRALVEATYQPHPSDSKEAGDHTITDARQSLLDLVMRHGILASWTYAVESPPIATLLLQQASSIVSDMGIYAAKYLQRLLPLITSVISNPFSTAHVPLMLAALDLQNMLIQCCWPRIKDKWWSECLRGSVGCWMVLEESEEKGTGKRGGEVRKQLQKTVALLAGVVGADFTSASARLTEEDETLDSLFNALPASA